MCSWETSRSQQTNDIFPPCVFSETENGDDFVVIVDDDGEEEEEEEVDVHEIVDEEEGGRGK